MAQSPPRSLPSLSRSALAPAEEAFAGSAAEALARAGIDAARSATRLETSWKPRKATVQPFGELQIRRGEEILVLRADGWRTPGFLLFDHAAAAAVIHAFLGGDERPSPTSSSRGHLASGVLKRLARVVLDAYGDAFALIDSLLAPRARVVSQTSEPPALLMREGEVILCQSLSLRLGPGSGELRLVWPLAAIQPALAAVVRKARARNRDPAAAARLASHLEEVEIEAAVVLGEAQLLLRDLIALEVGDVLELDRDGASPPRATLQVEGVPKGEGQVGTSRGRRALRLEAALGVKAPASGRRRR